MNAIDSIALCALLVGTTTYFYGEKAGCFLSFSDTPDTSRKKQGYQRKPNAHAGCTPDTPDTCQKVKVQVQNTKRGQKWASMT